MSYNRTLSRQFAFAVVVLDIAVAHWMVYLSTVGDKTDGLWFKFASIWAVVMVILTFGAALWLMDN